MSSFRPARSTHAPGAKAAGRRPGVQLLLALCLLFAQTGLFLHELEHQSTAPDAYCALCLAAQHIGDAVYTAPSLALASPPALPPLPVEVPPARAVQGVPFSARAPPVRS